MWFLVKRSAPVPTRVLLCMILGQNSWYFVLHFDTTAWRLLAKGYGLPIWAVHAKIIITNHHQKGLWKYFEHCTWYLLFSNLHSALCKLRMFWAFSYRSILHFFSFVCARAGYLATCPKAYNTFFPTWSVTQQPN